MTEDELKALETLAERSTRENKLVVLDSQTLSGIVAEVRRLRASWDAHKMHCFASLYLGSIR